MTALVREIMPALRAFYSAISICPLRGKRRNAAELALEIYESSQNHWAGVSAHMILSQKTAQPDQIKDGQQEKRK